MHRVDTVHCVIVRRVSALATGIFSINIVDSCC